MPLDVSLDSCTDDAATASGSTGIAVRKRKQNTSKNEAEKDKPMSKEKEMAIAGIECAMERLKKPPPATDEFHVFGLYVASELRSLKDPAYAKESQRKLNKLLLDIMESASVLRLLYCSIHSFTDIDLLLSIQVVQSFDVFVGSDGVISMLDKNVLP